ncbi:hypothetical protein ZWY2020_032293 [Hordeum vulgare]|nr:hypothetical protein ZWY2020_032293 [Hordeum vulgare]
MIPPPAPFGLSEPLSVAGDGSWRLSLIPEHTPVHLMLPVDDGKRRSSCPSTDLAGTSRGATLTRACPRSRADDSRPPPPSARVADLRRPGRRWEVLLRHGVPRPSRRAVREHRRIRRGGMCRLAPPPCPYRSSILAHLRHDRGMEFYIRVDRGGSFHTYPDLGGPFQGMQQAENAIDQYLRGRRVKKKCNSLHFALVFIALIPPCMEQSWCFSTGDGYIRRCLYWPDGTRKRRTKSYIFQKGHEHTSRLICAIVDEYNEEHNLYGDLAYEFKDLVHHQSFHEKEELYCHMNFNAKTKGAHGLDCLSDKFIFVEIQNIKQKGSDGEWAVNCFCMLEPTDNDHCGGCVNDVKHSNKPDAYVGDHVGADELCCDPATWSDSDEDESTKERRIRRMYEGRKPFVYPA